MSHTRCRVMTSRESRWPDNKRRHWGPKIKGLWNHIRRKCRASAEGNVASSICWGWKRTQTEAEAETEVFVRHQCPLVGHINCSVCLNAAPCIPPGYLRLDIEVGCHHGVRARTSVWLFVSPLGRGRATNVQLGSLRPSQTRAKTPHKTRQTLAKRERLIAPAGQLLTLLNIYWPCCHQVSNTLNCCLRHHAAPQCTQWSRDTSLPNTSSVNEQVFLMWLVKIFFRNCNTGSRKET